MRIPLRWVWAILAIGYLALGLGETGMSILFDMNREDVGIAFFLPAVLSMIIFWKMPFDSDRQDLQQGPAMKLTLTLWIVLATIAFLAAAYPLTTYHISLPFVLALSTASFVIMLQIFQISPSSRWYLVVLSEIILTSIILMYGYQFQFPGSIGNDSTYHLGIITQITNDGHIGEYPGQYTSYAAYHILMSELEIVADAGSKIGMALFGLIQVPFLLLVFVTVDATISRRAALVCTLLASFAPHLIPVWYMYYPNGFTVIFFMACLFLALRSPPSKKAVMLIILFFFLILLSHPLTPAILLYVLFIVFVGAKLFVNVKINLPWWLFGLLGVFTVLRWSSTTAGGGSILDQLVYSFKGLFSSDVGTSLSGVTTTGESAVWEVLLYDSGQVILMFLGILGAFIILRRSLKKGRLTAVKDARKAILFALVTLCTVPVPYILAVVYPNSAPDRWFMFTEILMCITAGFMVVLIAGSHGAMMKRVVGASIAFIVAFFVISTPMANPSSDLFDTNQSHRIAMLSSESACGQFADRYTNEDFFASYYYLLYINRTMINNYHYISAENARYFINPTDSTTYGNGTLAIREYEIENGFSFPKYGAGGQLINVEYVNSEFYSSLDAKHIIYCNPSVRLYYTP